MAATSDRHPDTSADKPPAAAAAPVVAVAGCCSHAAVAVGSC